MPHEDIVEGVKQCIDLGMEARRCVHSSNPKTILYDWVCGAYGHLVRDDLLAHIPSFCESLHANLARQNRETRNPLTRILFPLSSDEGGNVVPVPSTHEVVKCWRRMLHLEVGLCLDDVVFILYRISSAFSVHLPSFSAIL